MAVVIASDLAKDIAGEPLLRGVSFKLERRDRMTLSGRNGAGKTTLLRMLANEASVDGGELVFSKGVKVALHDQRPPRERSITLRDYILSGATELVELERELAALEQRMADGDYAEPTLTHYAEAQARLETAGGYDWRDRVLDTLRGLGFREGADLDRPLSTFSGGELTRASLGRALAGRPDLLLLDEPTNHLDIESLEWLEAHLIALDAAVVLVAHDRWFLEAVGTSVLELEGGRSRFFAGTWHTWRKEKAARELALGRAIERQQAEIERLERFVTRFRAGTRARQAQARQKRLDRIDRITRDPKDGAGLEFAFKAPSRTGRVVLELEDASLRAGDKQLLDAGEMWLERGEHVSLVGMNGTGKTTLIETLAGRRELASGKLRVGHNVEIGYLSQHAEELSAGGARTVLEAAQRLTGLKPGETRALLGRFLFSGEDAEKPLEALSGGERRRLSLAVLIGNGSQPPNFLILDEPTNHLDLESREALEAALAAFPGSLLLVSHDRALLDAVGSRTIELHGGELHSYVGGWPEYLRVRAERAAKPRVTGKQAGAAPRKNGTAPTVAAAQKSGTAPRAGGTKPKTKVRPARDPASTSPRGGGTRVHRLEEQIESAEAALAAVEEELADPAAWATPTASARSTARHEEARQRVAELYERYETVAG
jgi:ATP-binding cassette subfamily F protein 3